jgi:hypothetical protein
MLSMLIEPLHVQLVAMEAAVFDGTDEDTFVLMDHSFGYHCPWINSLRDEHSSLLIIEDYERALGACIDGQSVRYSGGYVYWIVRGNSQLRFCSAVNQCDIVATGCVTI